MGLSDRAKNLLRGGRWRREEAVCGHSTRAKGKIKACGASTKMTMRRSAEGRFDYCLDCVAAMTIRCAWCGEAVFVGSLVTLYVPRGDFEMPEYAVMYSEIPAALVGCPRMSCADSGADYAGLWVAGENGCGRVRPMSTAYDSLTGGPDIAAVYARPQSLTGRDPQA